tara:strand:+ start:6967 stop:7254 length:288 start_codon:yes stop_codon:yes gene_type:complete
MKKEEILKKSAELVTGDRAKDYGDALENFERIADGWDIIASQAYKTHERITAPHVALMMDWVKTARLLNNLDHEDSWIDKCGYSALGGSFPKEKK